MKNSGCHGNQREKPLKIFLSQTTNWIALLFCRNVPSIEVYRIPLKDQSTESTDRLANMKKVALTNIKLGWLIQD